MKKISIFLIFLAVIAAPVFADQGFASVQVAPEFFWGTHSYLTNDTPAKFMEMSLGIGFDGANFFGDSGFGVEYGVGGMMLFGERSGDEALTLLSACPWDVYANVGLGYMFVQSGFFTARVGFGLFADIILNGDTAIQYRGMVLDFYGSIKCMFSVASNVSIDLGIRFGAPLFSMRFQGNDTQEKISGGRVAPSVSVTYWY